MIELLFQFLLLGALLAVLVTSAKLVESSFIKISSRFRVNEFLLGFFVLAIVTSLPEISIALVSSNEVPELSLGNLIGATIVILTLILGISAIKYKGIEFKGKFSEKDVIVGMATILLMVVLIADGNVTVLDGAIMIGAYGVFIYHLYRNFTNTEQPALYLNLDMKNPIKFFAIGVLGALGIIISSFYVVSTSVDIANILGVSETFIGILVLAVGTNLPELTILLTSKNLEEETLAVGGFFGSACINVAIIGLLAVTSRGFQLESMLGIASGLVILVFAIVLFIILSWTGKKLSRTEGMLMIAVYIAFAITELLVLASII